MGSGVSWSELTPVSTVTIPVDLGWKRPLSLNRKPAGWGGEMENPEEGKRCLMRDLRPPRLRPHRQRMGNGKILLQPQGSWGILCTSIRIAPSQTLGPTPPLSGFCLQCWTFPTTDSPTFSEVSLLLQFGHDLVPPFGPRLPLSSRKWDGIASYRRCPEGSRRRLPTLCFELMINRTTLAFVCLLKTSVVFNSGCPVPQTLSSPFPSYHSKELGIWVHVMYREGDLQTKWGREEE